MKIEHGTIEGDLEVTEEYILHGMVEGNVTVKAGGVLHLHGTVCKDLFLEENSIVYLHGMVCGRVFNPGGKLEIYGMVAGEITEEKN